MVDTVKYDGSKLSPEKLERILLGGIHPNLRRLLWPMQLCILIPSISIWYVQERKEHHVYVQKLQIGYKYVEYIHSCLLQTNAMPKLKLSTEFKLQCVSTYIVVIRPFHSARSALQSLREEIVSSFRPRQDQRVIILYNICILTSSVTGFPSQTDAKPHCVLMASLWQFYWLGHFTYSRALLTGRELILASASEFLHIRRPQPGWHALWALQLAQARRSCQSK